MRLYCWAYRPSVFSVSWEMQICHPIRTTAVHAITGIVPMKARAVTGTSRPITMARERTRNLLECCRIDFLSILRRWRCQSLGVGHAEPVDDFQRGEVGMLVREFLSELRFKRMACAGPIIKRCRRELDYRTRFRLVGDEHVTLRELPWHVAQLFDRLDSRFGKMQHVSQPRELAHLRADELGFGVLQDCQSNRMRRLGCSHEVLNTLACGGNCAVSLPGSAEGVDPQSTRLYSSHGH